MARETFPFKESLPEFSANQAGGESRDNKEGVETKPVMRGIFQAVDEAAQTDEERGFSQAVKERLSHFADEWRESLKIMKPTNLERTLRNLPGGFGHTVQSPEGEVYVSFSVLTNDRGTSDQEEARTIPSLEYQDRVLRELGALKEQETLREVYDRSKRLDPNQNWARSNHNKGDWDEPVALHPSSYGERVGALKADVDGETLYLEAGFARGKSHEPGGIECYMSSETFKQVIGWEGD